MRALFRIAVTTAFVFSAMTFFHLNGSGAFWHVFSRGPFAGREWFTRTGWRCRNLALLCIALAAVLMFLE